MRNSDLTTSQNIFFFWIWSQIISFLVKCKNRFKKYLVKVAISRLPLSSLFPPSLWASFCSVKTVRSLRREERGGWLVLLSPHRGTCWGAGPEAEGGWAGGSLVSPLLPSSLQTLQARWLQKRPLPSQLAWLKLPTICAWALRGTQTHDTRARHYQVSTTINNINMFVCLLFIICQLTDSPVTEGVRLWEYNCWY